MGIINSPENFQHKTNYLFHWFEFIRQFVDEDLVLIKQEWTHHVQKLELTLNKIKEKRLKCNTEKSFFRKTEMEYLGFWVTCDGEKQQIKIQAIKYEATNFPK